MKKMIYGDKVLLHLLDGIIGYAVSIRHSIWLLNDSGIVALTNGYYISSVFDLDRQ